jgi:hypothetical protein
VQLACTAAAEEDERRHQQQRSCCQGDKLANAQTCEDLCARLVEVFWG